jgi:PAS domain S-box-containing protein
MNDPFTTMPELIKEISALKKRIQELEQSETKHKRAEEALRESEKKYRSVIENIQDVFYRSDTRGVLLMGSPSGARMFGYDSVDAMIGLPLDSFWPDPAERQQLLDQIMATGGVKDFEAVLKKKDGTTFNASFTTHFYYDDQGNFLGTEGIIRDITDCKKMEEAIHESEEKYRNLVEYTTDWVWEMDYEGKLTYSNHNISDLLGYEPEEMIGRTHFEFLIPEHSEHSRKVFQENKSFQHLQCTFRHRNGALVTLDTSAVSILDDQGLKYRGVTRDITELKNAEEELKKSEERFRRIAENSRDIIYRMSLPDGKYEYISPAVIEITGYLPEELYNDASIFRKVIHPGWQNYFIQEWEKLVQGKAPPFYEYIIINKSGAERWLNQRNVLIFDSDGNPIAIEGIVTDITDRKLAEEEREKLILELQEALAKIKTLTGLLPICSSCKKIRNDKGCWEQMETYIMNHTEADFSHGICPECAEKLYPEYYKKK